MPRAGFEPAIPMFERPKTGLALDRAAIETGTLYTQLQLLPNKPLKLASGFLIPNFYVTFDRNEINLLFSVQFIMYGSVSYFADCRNRATVFPSNFSSNDVSFYQEMLVSHHITTWHHNPEYQDLNF
jgi:hypothetical protein